MSQQEAKSPFSFSLIDFKALEKPAIKLIETIADAAGVLYEPRRIVKRAQAEVAARVIGAQGDVIAEDIAERARRRIERSEIRRQENIENISRLALRYLPGAVDPDPVVPDWTSRFFECCADVSDEQMQTLWANLLAGEVAKPGSYSPRTLSVVQDMRPADAHAFTKFATFVWSVSQDRRQEWFPMLRTWENTLQESGIGFNDLIQLEALGLLRVEHTQEFSIRINNGQVVNYYGADYRLTAKVDANPHLLVETGPYVLTHTGQELVPIAGGKPDEAYRERVLMLWNQIMVVERLPA